MYFRLYVKPLSGNFLFIYVVYNSTLECWLIYALRFKIILNLKEQDKFCNQSTKGKIQETNSQRDMKKETGGDQKKPQQVRVSKKHININRTKLELGSVPLVYIIQDHKFKRNLRENLTCMSDITLNLLRLRLLPGITFTSPLYTQYPKKEFHALVCMFLKNMYLL